MKSKIVLEPHPTLRARAHKVSAEEFHTKKLADIIATMNGALRATDDGIGIAAPQIGVSKRIFLASEEALAIDRDEKPHDSKKGRHWKYYVFINPEIFKKSSAKNTSAEGCLSMPGKYGTVLRSEKIKIRALDETGKPFEQGASGLFARLLQHEVDHLEGILFIDKAKKITSPKKHP